MKGNTIAMPTLVQKLRNWNSSVSTPMPPAISLMVLSSVPPEKKRGTKSDSRTSTPAGCGTQP